MQRREFITLARQRCGCVATCGACAAEPERMRRVGILMPYPPSNMVIQTRVRVLREELRNRGWTAGGNVQFDERWTTDNMDLIRAAAANLLELKPDVVVAIGGRVIPVLMQMTCSIPIIVPGGIDPVESGWAESLARPGGNVTGFAILEGSIVGKMLQMLKEIAPSVSRVAMIYNPDNPGAARFARSLEASAGLLAVQPIFTHVHGLADIERAIATLAEQPGSGIFFAPDLTVQGLSEQTVAIVARHRLPAIYSERAFVTIGGLVYYGADRVDLYRRAASYVDRVLRGEKPSDLPYQLPTGTNL